MKKYYTRILSLVLVLSCFILLSSCYTEDPGALQRSERQFSITDFDKLELGSAFIIEVNKGDNFSISAKGDARNLDDLKVYKNGSSLIVKYDDNHNRKHDTYLYITMPELLSAKLSGASDSKISGFSTSNNTFDFYLSGASYAQVDMIAAAMNLDVSGASHLNITGATATMDVDVSGASVLSAFNLVAEDAHVHASGASEAKVDVTTSLHASASGASTIVYKGSPMLTCNTSGASSIHHD
ncbi:MAG TPA: head GIN domain-containing protein [Cyclobacteriaceae bacterium]